MMFYRLLPFCIYAVTLKNCLERTGRIPFWRGVQVPALNQKDASGQIHWHLRYLNHALQPRPCQHPFDPIGRDLMVTRLDALKQRTGMRARPVRLDQRTEQPCAVIIVSVDHENEKSAWRKSTSARSNKFSTA